MVLCWSPKPCDKGSNPLRLANFNSRLAQLGRAKS